MDKKKGLAKRFRALIFGSLALISIANVAEATPATFWSDSASFGGPILTQWDVATGAKLQEILMPHGSNGRGIVVVGDIAYYTDAGDNHVYAYNVATHTDLGTAFTVAAASALSTIAYDGTNFWVGDYSGTNHAYLYTPTGTLLKTISLANCTGQCDGLEYLNINGGELISNRADEPSPGIYDVYDLNGALVKSAFITDNSASTGIAYDGTFYYVDNGGDPNTVSPHVNVYDANGAFVRTIVLTGFTPMGGVGYTGEDLSFDYSVVLPPPSVPEPASFVLLGSGLVGLVFLRRRRA
jgi:hypothetical protein